MHCSLLPVGDAVRHSNSSRSAWLFRSGSAQAANAATCAIIDYNPGAGFCYLSLVCFCAQTALGFSMAAPLLCWHRRRCFADRSRVPPPPIRQLRFQSTYTIQSQIIPRHSCSPLPITSARHPPGGGCFVANKSLMPFDRTVTERSKLLFIYFSRPFLRCFHSLSAVRRFSKIFVSLTPRGAVGV